MLSVLEKAREIPITFDVDVIVVGAGVTGCVAAIASARGGARTLLIERSGMLGGVATSGLMASITNFFFCLDGRQIVKGIPEELIDALATEGVTSSQWRTSKLPQIVHNPEVFQVILWRKLQEAGADILLYSWVSEPILEGSQIAGVIIENKAGRQALRAKVVVDATGDVDIAFKSGAPCIGRERGGDTVMFRMGNVDLQKTYEYLKTHPENFGEDIDIATPFEEFETNWLEKGIFHFPHGGGRILSALQEAIQDGKYAKDKGMAHGLDALGLYGVKGSKTVLVNSNFFSPRELIDIKEVSQATLEGRERCLELATFLKNILPGFEDSFVTQTAPEIGIRLTRWIEGMETLSWEDIISGKENAHVVGVLPRLSLTKHGVKVEEGFFDIPYGVLLPQKVDGLLVASGKGISATLEAHGRILRGQTSCMILGQAAGVAAALSVKEGTSPRSLNEKSLQQALLRADVYLGDSKKLARLELRP